MSVPREVKENWEAMSVRRGAQKDEESSSSISDYDWHTPPSWDDSPNLSGNEAKASDPEVELLESSAEMMSLSSGQVEATSTGGTERAEHLDDNRDSIEQQGAEELELTSEQVGNDEELEQEGSERVPKEDPTNEPSFVLSFDIEVDGDADDEQDEAEIPVRKSFKRGREADDGDDGTSSRKRKRLPAKFKAAIAQLFSDYETDDNSGDSEPMDPSTKKKYEKYSKRSGLSRAERLVRSSDSDNGSQHESETQTTLSSNSNQRAGRNGQGSNE